MIRLTTTELEHAEAAAGQFRLRDLLLATLAFCLILGGGRLAGGAIDEQEGMLLAAAMVSIVLAALILRVRAIWYGFLIMSCLATVLLAPGNLMVKWTLGLVAAAHLFFAALPVIAASPLQNRWRWTAAAGACQLAAAMFTPASAAAMVGVGALLSWSMAVAAVIFHYRSIPRPVPPDVESIPRQREHSPERR
jgi:hypothetical protein